MDSLISPAHYEFLLEKSKIAIRHDFDNCGNWIHRQRIIDDCISYEMPQEFISEFEADQEFEIGHEKRMSQLAREESQQAAMPAKY